MNQRDSYTIIPFLNSHIRNSKFLTSNSLEFKPSRATCELPPLAATFSYVPSLYSVKGLNQNET